jgi:hypothetical protein
MSERFPSQVPFGQDDFMHDVGRIQVRSRRSALLSIHKELIMIADHIPPCIRATEHHHHSIPSRMLLPNLCDHMLL